MDQPVLHRRSSASRPVKVPEVFAGDPSEDRVVIVWRVRLDICGGASERLLGDLAPGEVERLRRLGRSKIARRWLASRAALRGILGLELGVSAAEVSLKLGAQGRPGLDPDIHEAELDFNLSHSADLALVATARGLRVGVDVERLRRGRDPLRVAGRYFAPSEVAALRALPETDRPAAFFRFWTAKEALTKGLGLGLPAAVGKLELARQPGGELAPVLLARDWRLAELIELPSDYYGALAIQGGPAGIRMRDWPLDRLDEAQAVVGERGRVGSGR
jgi:4'-phosphopantetheinyl transferase